MIRWCAYCQRYLGETPPFSNFAMTHGICAACLETRRSLSSADFEKIHRIGAFYSELREITLKGDIEGIMKAIASDVTDLGIKPKDLLMGIFQPLLYEIGEGWAQGVVNVEQEHRFTALAEQLFQEVVKGVAKQPGALESEQERTQVLLTCAEGNLHSLGVRVLSIALNEAGIKTDVLYPSQSSASTLSIIKALNPVVLGISASLPEQRKAVDNLLQAISDDTVLASLKVLVGGISPRLSAEHWQGLKHADIAPVALDEIVDLIKSVPRAKAS